MSKNVSRVLLAVGGFFALVLLLLVGAAAWDLLQSGAPSQVPYNLAVVLLSAASLALFAFSILVAVLSFVGWRQIQSYIDQSVQSALSELHKEHQGMLHTMVGYMYGWTARTETEEEIEVEDHDLLQDAIHHSRRAYRLLDGNEKQAKAQNNLVFYYALDGRARYARRATQLAKDLLDFWDERDEDLYLTTYARVVAAYPTHFGRTEVREFRDRLAELCESNDLGEEEIPNARRHLAALDRALASEL